MSEVKSLQFNIWREDGTRSEVTIAENEVPTRLAELHEQGWTEIQCTLDVEQRCERDFQRGWKMAGEATAVAVEERIRTRSPAGRKPNGPKDPKDPQQ